MGLALSKRGDCGSSAISPPGSHSRAQRGVLHAAIGDHAEQKADQLADRIRAQKAKLSQRQTEASSRKTESFLNVGETLLGFFTERKRSLKTVVSGSRMSANAEQRAQQAADELDDLQEKTEQLALEL